MNDGIHFGEFLDCLEEQNRPWKQVFGRHPEALDLLLDLAGEVRSLVPHLFAVKRYGDPASAAGARSQALKRAHFEHFSARPKSYPSQKQCS